MGGISAFALKKKKSREYTVMLIILFYSLSRVLFPDAKSISQKQTLKYEDLVAW